MMRFIISIVFILDIVGCVVWAVVANEERNTIQKEYNQQFQDTPLYYKRYMETSVLYKYKHKH